MTRPCDDPLAEGSLWTATAAPADHPPLAEDLDVDVAVIGAGFTGLSAALHLAEAGASVVLIDAQSPGWGASGRNGGQVIPGLKATPRDLPDGAAARVMEACEGSAEMTFGLVRRLGLDCDAVQGGWAQVAPDARRLRPLAAKVESAAGRAAGLVLLDAREIADRLGTSGLAGGLFDARAGTLHPLRYALALARAAADAGTRIHGRTRALRIAGEPGAMTVTTTGGTIRCGTVLTGPNGYADGLLPEIRAALVPVISIQVATDPLPQGNGPRVMPGGVAASDIRRLTTYYRADAEGRLVFGGRGAFSRAGSEPLFADLRRTAEALFPQVKGRAVWRHAWGGRVAVTGDGAPRLAQPRPGVFAGYGYNGRGVAMATLMGRELALRALGRAEQDCRLPVTPPRPVRLHRFRRLGVAATVRAFRALDRMGL